MQAIPRPTAQDATLVRLIDERRKASAIVADLDMQIAHVVGDRDGMRRAQREMYAQVEARRATRFAARKARR